MFIFINLIIVNVGNEGIVKKLIASGVDVNSENNEGETPLYYSVRMSESFFFTLLKFIELKFKRTVCFERSC